jgi:hypothetical protein
MRRTLVAMAFTASLMTAVPSSLFDRFWTILSTVWGTTPSSTEAGCGADPNGRCLPAPQPHLDAGCGADPDGRCLPPPQPQLDAGCGMDPDGRCKSGS